LYHSDDTERFVKNCPTRDVATTEEIARSIASGVCIYLFSYHVIFVSYIKHFAIR
jgi:hypothetical protein